MNSSITNYQTTLTLANKYRDHIRLSKRSISTESRVSNALSKLHYFNPKGKDDKTIREELLPFKDIIFDFLPELIKKVATDITEFAIETKHNLKDSPSIGTLLDTYKEIYSEVFATARSAIELKKTSGYRDQIHNEEVSPNGKDVQDKRVESGIFDIQFDEFAKIRAYKNDFVQGAFERLNDTLKIYLTDFSGKIQDLWANTDSDLIQSDSEFKFFLNEYKEVLRRSYKALDQLNQFILEFRAKLPQDLENKMIKIHKEGPAEHLKILGAQAYRLLTDPRKVYPSSKNSAAQFHSNMNRIDKDSNNYPTQQQP
jgi:hypothetical protein